MSREANKAQDYIRSWVFNPNINTICGHYYTVNINNKSFLLNYSSAEAEVSVIAVRFIGTDTILIDPWLNRNLPSGISFSTFETKKLVYLYLSELELIFKEDITQIELLDSDQHNRTLVKCGERNYFTDFKIERSAPISVGLFRSDSEASRKEHLSSPRDYVLRRTTGNTIKEARKNLFPDLKDTDVILNSEVYLSKMENQSFVIDVDFMDKLKKDCLFCPDIIASDPSSRSLRDILSTKTDLSLKIWSYLYAKYVTCPVTMSDLSLSAISRIAKTNTGELIVDYMGAFYKVIPRNDLVFVYSFRSPLSTTMARVNTLPPDIKEVLKSPIHENFYVQGDI